MVCKQSSFGVHPTLPLLILLIIDGMTCCIIYDNQDVSKIYVTSC